MKVLILSARAPVALEWARQFANNKWEVFLTDHQVGRLSHQSTFNHVFVPTPAAKTDPMAYVMRLKELIETHQIDWLMPTCEEIFYVAYFRKFLPPHCQIFCSEFDLLRRLHHKSDFQQLSQKIGLNSPATLCVTETSHATWQSSEQRVLKPVYSRFGHQVRFLAAFEPLPDDVPVDGSWLLQRRKHGQEICSFSLAVSGRLLAHQAYIGTYRYKQGASFYFKPIENNQIFKQMKAFVEKTQFTGQLGFDWMLDKNNVAWVLECNPRATSGLHLLAQNHNLVQALQNTQPIPAFDPTPMMLSPMMLSVALPQAFLQGQLCEWWQNYRAADDVLGHWKHHFGAIQDLIKCYGNAKKLNVSLEAASSVDFEFDGNI